MTAAYIDEVRGQILEEDDPKRAMSLICTVLKNMDEERQKARTMAAERDAKMEEAIKETLVNQLAPLRKAIFGNGSTENSIMHRLLMLEDKINSIYRILGFVGC